MRNFTYSAHLFIVLCLLSFNKVKGQSYTFNPGLIYTTYVDTSANNFGGIEIQNTSSQPLNLTWRLALTDTLIDSYFQLCNSGICFLNLPGSGQLPTLLPGDIGWIKFHIFSGRANGLNTIKYVLKNGALQKDTLTFKIYVVNNVTEVNNIKNFNKDEIEIYPNPAKDFAVVGVKLNTASSVEMSIYDMIGKLVYSNNAQVDAKHKELTVNTREFASGVYNVIVKTEKGILKDKLSVVK